MQYKTVTINSSLLAGKKEGAINAANERYAAIINQEAAQGWRLLGIHPVTVYQKKGCLSTLLPGPDTDTYQADIFIFFRE